MKRGEGRQARVLVVEDDLFVREGLARALEDEGYEVLSCSSAEDGAASLNGGDLDLVLTDLRLPGASGLDVVDQAKARVPNCPVLVITAHASVDTAVEAMRRGAFHYLSKPISLDTFLVEVEKALEHGRALREREMLRMKLSSEQGLGRIVGESVPITALREMILNVARTESTVLVTGETGTGKELVANALHYESYRAAGPLVKVNCAALSETLLESELFGHEKGAFTGAERHRAGRFERADGGTLFLDEISEMGIHVQAKLLRVLQGEAFERVGGDEELRADVRVVAATNRDPEQAVEEGRLRRDLFYRLNIVRIEMSPLREHLEDIPVLAMGFLAKHSARLMKRLTGISLEAIESLKRHDWPGNVRELENCIELAAALTHGSVVEKENLPAPISGTVPDGSTAPEETLNLREVEKRAVLRALAESNWSKARAAKRLGIFPSSLHKKMRRLGIPLKRPE